MMPSYGWIVEARRAAAPSLDQLSTASAELLGRRELLDRIDRKYVATVDQVEAFVAGLSSGYHVLRSSGKAWARYETCYFDTDDLHGFHEHLRGRRPRYKVRVRRHVERRRAFLEIKAKRVGERTEKHRRERDYEQLALSTSEREFIARRTPFDVERLHPSVWTNFSRATLLGLESEERVTIDVGLCFERNGVSLLPRQLAIIELKQRRCSHASYADRALHALGVREHSMSKYCAGVASLHEAARPRYRELLLKRLARNQAWTNT